MPVIVPTAWSWRTPRACPGVTDGALGRLLNEKGYRSWKESGKSMTWFDYAVIAIIVVSVITSAARGLVREVLSLAAWMVAFFVANQWATDVAAMLPDSLTGAMLRLIVAFVALLVAALIVGGIVNWAIARVIRTTGLQFADRGMGGLFGLARGILIVLTVVILAGLTSLPQQPAWRNALLAPLAVEGVRTIKPLLPESWARYVHY
jgi:membrane protein required for colicin V production